MLQTCLKSPLLYDEQDAASQTRKGIKDALKQYVPWYVTEEARLTGGYDRRLNLKEYKRRPTEGRTAREYRNLARRTANLVRVPIDKAPGELLFC